MYTNVRLHMLVMCTDNARAAGVAASALLELHMGGSSRQHTRTKTH